MNDLDVARKIYFGYPGPGFRYLYRGKRRFIWITPENEVFKVNQFYYPIGDPRKNANQIEMENYALLQKRNDCFGFELLPTRSVEFKTEKLVTINIQPFIPTWSTPKSTLADEENYKALGIDAWSRNYLNYQGRKILFDYTPRIDAPKDNLILQALK